MIYQNDSLREVRFPLGGIGTGSICMAGNGRFCDWEIQNRPNKGSRNGHSHIAVSALTKGRRQTRVLNGDIDTCMTGQYGSNYGFGPSGETMCGFPHFANVVMDGQFPIAQWRFSDPHFPGKIVLTAFSPFIPGDSENSSLPAAMFDLCYENDTDDQVELTGVLSVRNLFEMSVNRALSDRMVLLQDAAHAADALEYGDMTIAVDGESCGVQEYWYRSGWLDHIVKFWNELSQGALLKRHYDKPGKGDTASVYGKVTAAPGESKRIRFVMTWNVPNRCNDWSTDGDRTPWKNYYATRWENSIASANYVLNHYDDLFARTDAFRQAMFSQTLDSAVIDAATSTLAVLRSPTVLRLENGEFYGWEGVKEGVGSCEGTCQHVWGYAYALCFLFPDLERSIHDLELKYSMAEDGRTGFRLRLPLGSGVSDFRACLDGQMGIVLRLYRDWKISGDTDKLRAQWPSIQKLIAYAWSEENPDRWDRNRDGVLEGRQHHTLDMELFGPHAWLQGFYLGALKAGAEMAHELGDPIEAEYRDLFERGYAWTRDNLFNGEYFVQQVDLTDKSILDSYENAEAYWESECGQIKYQIVEGCEIDQLCAQWHANLIGLGRLFDDQQIASALKALYRNNHKPSMREFTNPWRIFALNDEAATVMCDYPEGTQKPVIPIPYCEESMHGFEYQLAGLLISEGMVEEGLTVARAVRARYDGQKRDPYNEIECGSNYARSMASFALIPIFAGFSYDMPHGKIGFKPITGGDFRALWSLDCGWGVFERKGNEVCLSVAEGKLPIRELGLSFAKTVADLTVDGQFIAAAFVDGALHFDALIPIQKELRCTYMA